MAWCHSKKGSGWEGLNSAWVETWDSTDKEHGFIEQKQWIYSNCSKIGLEPLKLVVWQKHPSPFIPFQRFFEFEPYILMISTLKIAGKTIKSRVDKKAADLTPLETSWRVQVLQLIAGQLDWEWTHISIYHHLSIYPCIHLSFYPSDSIYLI